MINIVPEAILIPGIIFDFHKIITNRGDKGISMEGEPNIPCNLNGKGKIAAPNIENEKVRMIKTGIVFNPFSFAVL